MEDLSYWKAMLFVSGFFYEDVAHFTVWCKEMPSNATKHLHKSPRTFPYVRFWHASQDPVRYCSINEPDFFIKVYNLVKAKVMLVPTMKLRCN